nr:MAG TPA: hypothetical protein [Caudoviricetes sp.]
MFVWLMPRNIFLGKFTICTYPPGVFSNNSMRIEQIIKDPYCIAFSSSNFTLSAKSVLGQYGVHGTSLIFKLPFKKIYRTNIRT